MAAHPEPKGAKLVASNLTEAEASELEALDAQMRAAADDPPGAEPLTEKQTRRYEELLGALAGDREMIPENRKANEMQGRKAALIEQFRRDSLPRRAEWAEVGSVTLPRFLFSWLESSRKQEWTVADLGMPAAMLLMFENRISLFPTASFEEVEVRPSSSARGRSLTSASRRGEMALLMPGVAALSVSKLHCKPSFGTSGSRPRRQEGRSGSSLASAREKCAKARIRHPRLRESLGCPHVRIEVPGNCSSRPSGRLVAYGQRPTGSHH
jgi:hypothetical protein